MLVGNLVAWLLSSFGCEAAINFQGLAATQGIYSAQNQGGRKDGQNYSEAVHDKCAPLRAFRQCASRKDQKNRRDDRCACERAVKGEFQSHVLKRCKAHAKPLIDQKNFCRELVGIMSRRR